jgi:hypothetical protein
VRLLKVENPLLEVVKHADLHCMEEVGLREVSHNTWNLLKHVESSVSMARREFGICCLGVGIAERSIQEVIPRGVLLVTMHIMSKFVRWTFAPNTDMPLEMMKVAILWKICKPCCQNRFAMPEVAICTENVVIPTPGAGILFKGEWLELLPEYFVQHLSVYLPLLIQLLLRNIAHHHLNRWESDHYDMVR